jgi:hypothetical protein
MTRIAFRLIRLAVLIGLAALLALLLWPFPPPGDPGQPADAVRALTKLSALEQACAEQVPTNRIFYEYEVNALLAELLKGSGSGRPGPGLGRINLHFTSAGLGVYMVSGIGPVRITGRLDGVVAVRDGRFDVHIRRVWIGRVPAPAAAAGWFIRRAAGQFADLQEDWQWTRRLRHARITPGRVLIAVDG